MPAAILADWSAIRALYVQGIAPKIIADRFKINVNTLYSRVRNEKWQAPSEPVHEQSARIAADIWTERRAATREKIHRIGDKMLKAAEELPENELLTKADKVKIATEIAGKVVGLDQGEEKNQINISLLSQIVENEPSIGTISMLHSEPLQIQDA
jgi:hypothetical protein